MRDESINAVEMAKGLLALTATALGASAAAKAADAVLKPFGILSGVSEEVARSRTIDPNVNDILRHINMIIGDVETKAGKPLLVVVDGLDKLQREEQARAIFLESGVLKGVRCRVIYTVPMLIAAMNEFEQVVQDEIGAIEKALTVNMGVRRLAANPLMLTILALIHRNGASLPSRRVELYELAADTLLESWQRARGIPEAKVVKKSEALLLLGPLAYWLHEKFPSGMARASLVKEQLARALSTQRSLDPDHLDVQLAVEDFLQRVREHIGLFVERAPGYYGFMHLTFEEYFVGRELVRRSEDAAQRIYEHRHLPRWEEPILLAVGFVSKDRPEDAGDLIETAILAEGDEAKHSGYRPSRYEDVLHRDLLLAGQCIGDTAGVDSALRDRVTWRLAELVLDRNAPRKCGPLHARIAVVLSSVGRSDSWRTATVLFLAAA